LYCDSYYFGLFCQVTDLVDIMSPHTVVIDAEKLENFTKKTNCYENTLE